jgi:dolichol-phosphate mannosyltransferase
MNPAELAIIIPTYNEKPNLRPLLERLHKVLDGIIWETIFVDDDSGDGTGEEVQKIALEDPRVRCIRRIGRRGLSSACIEGMASTSARFLAVMDADLQHDEAILPAMLHAVKTEGFDMAVGSRYVEGGGISKEWNPTRQMISRTATVLGQKMTRCKVADPMSGFFLLKREVFWETVHSLSGRGFKILLDLLASSPRPLKVKEVPFQFRLRQAGESKLDGSVALDYLLLLADKTVGLLIPVRFIMFVAVGSLGAVLHLSILGGLLKVMGKDFWISQAFASLCAMMLNFTLNNFLTYRDRRLKGTGVITGLLLFIVVCSVGAFTNVQLAEYLYSHHIDWWFAGLFGAAIGSVWNYAVSTQLVWRKKSWRATQAKT